MMFVDWILGLFGRGRQGRPCNLCRCTIPPRDIDKGLAVVIARQQYCKGCVEEITLRRNRGEGWTMADMGSSSTVLFR